MVGLCLTPVAHDCSWRIKIHLFSSPPQDSEIEAGVSLSVQTPPDLPQLAALRASSHVQHDPLVPELPELCLLCQPGIYISLVPGVPVFSLVNIETTVPPWVHHLAPGRL